MTAPAAVTAPAGALLRHRWASPVAAEREEARAAIRAALESELSVGGAATALSISRATLTRWIADAPELAEGLTLRGPGRPAREYHADYTGRGGEHETVTGDSLESIAAQLVACGYDGPHLRVRDAQGSTRGWAWVEDDAPGWAA